jgi:hypothetical protein
MTTSTADYLGVPTYAYVTVTVNFLDPVTFDIPYVIDDDDINSEILFESIRKEFSNIGVGDTLTISVDEIKE